MADNKTQVVELLKVKNQKIEEFKTATLSCITNMGDYKTDLDKADKYIEYVETRKECVEYIERVHNTIKNTPEFNDIFESSDEEIIKLKDIYMKDYESIKKLQSKMDTLGQSILVEMRSGFKQVKQQQKANTLYLNSPYTSGTKFDVKQ